MSQPFITEAYGPLANQPDANRGASVPLRTGQSQKVVKLPSRNAGDGPGRLLAVVLGITLKDDNNKNKYPITDVFVWPRVRAVIGFGIGGVRFEAKADYLLGTVLSVPGETEDVSAEYCMVTPPWIPLADTPSLDCCPEFQVSAAFAYQPAGHNSNPSRLTELIQIENPGQTQQIQIPQFAISFSVLLINGSTSADARMYGFGKNYNVPIKYTAPVSNIAQHNVENATPIPNGVRFIEFTNTNAAGPLFAFVIFGLSI